MVHIRECMRRWLPFVIMAASLGVSPAQDVASPDAADLDLDLVKLKSGPKGRQREAMRKVLLLVHLKQKETWLAESTGDEAVHLAAEISFRRYLASVDMGGCPGEFKCAFLRYAKLLNSFEEKDLNSVADFPAVPVFVCRPATAGHLPVCHWDRTPGVSSQGLLKASHGAP